MSTKPRTPEHFPRMKHRAAGRPYRHLDSALKRLSKTLEGAAREYRKMGDAAYTMGENFKALQTTGMVVFEDGDCGCDLQETVLD